MTTSTASTRWKQSWPRIASHANGVGVVLVRIRLLHGPGADILEDGERVAAGIVEAVARAVGNLKRFAFALPAPSFEFLYGLLQVFHCQHGQATRGRAVVGQEQQRAITESHSSDPGTK